MPENIHQLPPDIRPYIRKILPSATVSRNSRALPGTRHCEVAKVPTRTIYIDGYNTVIVNATKDPTWLIHTIQFNPGNTLNGHNGHILTEEEFFRALTLLGQLVKPLLANPDEWLRVIPGVIADSPSHWLNLEIPYQIPDDTGEILKAFQNAKHSRINLPPLYTRNGQSIAFSNSEGDLLIRIYRKDIEMAAKRGGRKGSSSTSVLRLEVALEGDELKHYMPCATWKIIEGTQRLVSFRPDNLRQAHHAVMTPFQGSYTRVPTADGITENDEKLGRYMGWVARETGLSVDDQFDYYRQRFLGRNKITSIRNAKSTLHRAARKELALLSPVKLEELFSDSAWNSQPAVSARKLEAITHARHDQIETHPLVREAYGSTSSS